MNQPYNNMMNQQPMNTQQAAGQEITGQVVSLQPNGQFNSQNGPMYKFLVSLDSMPGQPISVNAKAPSGPPKGQMGMTVTLTYKQTQYGLEGKVKSDFVQGGAPQGGGGGGSAAPRASTYMSVDQQITKEKEIRKSGCYQLAAKLFEITNTGGEDIDVLTNEVIRIGNRLYTEGLTAPEAPQQQPGFANMASAHLHQEE